MRKVNVFVIFLLIFANVFSTMAFSKSDCVLPHETGPIRCLAYIQVYTWNDSSKKCEPVIYGGCNKTGNNFATLVECEKTAKAVCS
ncbi:kappaPI-actitoxin-Avd3b-like [Sitophilus oryzae]|uniref:KappaPI-actitoxin-Avd3b-like n=1 Tax=Sitophilus oryzae TaxID=7048 RepID=A0A6J2Y2Z8_SITOR|nr:kappaPI-actitoxin-Avd3b-like [Sitophilus oryzae]